MIRFGLLFVVLASVSELCGAKSALLYDLDLERHTRQADVTPVVCRDQPQCATTPDICTSGDPDIANSLCPVTCGGCVCEDNAATGGSCSSLAPDICTEDLGVTLCPRTCGFCAAAGTTPPPTVVTETSPPITVADPDCQDQVVGITCAELPYPCNDELGRIACKKFCNLCPALTTETKVASINTAAPTVPIATTAAPALDTTQSLATTAAPSPDTTQSLATTAAPSPDNTQSLGKCAAQPCLNGGVCLPSDADTYICVCPDSHSGVICHIATSSSPPPTAPPATSPNNNNRTCPDYKTTKNNIGCIPAEIVFMIEYSQADASWTSVDHEGDYIKELIDEWQLSDSHVRVGVVVYHDDVTESIHLGDYDSKRDLSSKISSLTRRLRASGVADLGKALDHAREKSFVGARPGVERILVPIIHQTSSPEKERILPAAQRLKDDCIILCGVAVQGSSLDYDLVKDAVTQPSSDYAQYYRSYSEMEYIIKTYYKPNCDG